MKKPVDDEDMPNEIDFTGTVRGKYASRYREGVSIREISPLDPIAFYETQSRLGHALWQAQTLEAAFVAYFSLVQEMAVQEAGAHAHELLEHQAIGKQQTHHLRQFLDLKDVSERFYRLLPERNWIVHRCTFELSNLAESPDRRHDITVRLEGFADEAQYLSQYLISLVEVKLSRRGMSPAEIEQRTKQVIKAWAAA